MRAPKIRVYRIFSQPCLQDGSDGIDDLCLPDTIVTAETRRYRAQDIGVQCCHGVSPLDCGFPLGPIESIDTGSVIDLLCPTLFALLIYMFMRVSAELHMNVEDCYLSISVEHWPLIGVRTTQTARRKKVF